MYTSSRCEGDSLRLKSLRLTDLEVADARMLLHGMRHSELARLLKQHRLGQWQHEGQIVGSRRLGRVRGRRGPGRGRAWGKQVDHVGDQVSAEGDGTTFEGERRGGRKTACKNTGMN